MIPVVLSISFEDMAGKQGILTDIKTHQALQVYGVGINQGALKAVEDNVIWNSLEYIREKLSFYQDSLQPTAIKFSFIGTMPYWKEMISYLGKYADMPFVVDSGLNDWTGISDQQIKELTDLLEHSHSLLIIDDFQLESIFDENFEEAARLVERSLDKFNVNVLIRDCHLKDREGHLLIQKVGTWLWIESEAKLHSICGASDTLSAGISAYIARGRALKKSIVDTVAFIESVRDNVLYFEDSTPVLVPSKLKIIERICDMKKVLFIINPTSGKGSIKSECLDIVDIFTKAGYITTTYPTQFRGDASRCVKDIGHLYDMIVCSGGDGTLDEVVTGMMEVEMNQTPLGYIPTGSTNDFAKTLNIPMDMIKASKLLSRSKEFRCDIGEFMDTYFVYVAAFGIFADVSYKTDQGLKNALGHVAYILEGIKSLTNIQTYNLKVTGDGQTYEDTFIYGMISNSTSVGGFEGITGNDVELSDGLFEVTLVKYPNNILELNQIVSCLNNSEMESEIVITFKASRIQVVSTDDKEIPWSLDGEYGGVYKRVNIQNHQEAIPFLVDKDMDM